MNFKRLVILAISTAIVLAVMPQTGFADDKADVTAAVHQFFDNIPKSPQKALAACDSPVSIIDDFPPHTWSGAKACADWWKGFSDLMQKNGLTDAVAKLDAPVRLDVTGDRAYFICHAVFSYKDHGKPASEPNSVVTAALHKTKVGWRIAAWSWAGH